MADSKSRDQAKVNSAEKEYESAKKQSSDSKKKAAVAVGAVVATVATAGAAAPAAGGAAATAGGGAAAGSAAAGTTAGTATGAAAAGTEAGVTGTAVGAEATSGATQASTQASNVAEKGKEAADKFKEFEEKAKKAKEKYDKVKEKVDKVEELTGDDDEGEEEEDEEGDGEIQYSGSGAGATKKRKLPTILVILTLGALMPFLLLSAALFYPVHLAITVGDKVVTFFETIFDKAKYVFCELLGIGSVPEETAESFKEYGIEIGAVTSTGDFVQTNRVIASGPEYIIAASDGSNFQAASGELSIRFNGRVISASDFQAELDTDPKLFEAFYKAIEYTSKSYDEDSEYSAKSAAYEDLGLSKNPYAGYYDTELEEGTSEEEYFANYFANFIDGKESGTIVGTSGEEDSGEASTASYTQAEEYIHKVAQDTSANGVLEATEKAGALLNAAISSNESYYSARAYSAVMEAIDLTIPNRTEATPVNEVMTILDQETESKTVDPETGSSVTVTGSASLAPNLKAITQDDEFDKEVAAGYSRDRAINTTSYLATIRHPEENNNSNCVGLSTMYKSTKNTIVSIEDVLTAIWRWIASLIFGNNKPDESVLIDATKESISEALFTDPSESMVGQTLGERFVEGAAYYNVVQAREVGASTVSDENAVVAYTDMTTKVIAQKAAADRATKSPFDASSPYTFLGSIVSSLQPLLKSNGTIINKVTAVNSLASKSLAKITTGAYADNDDDIYQRNYGDCTTENSVGGEGDMFCNENPTFDTSTFSMTLADFESRLSSNFNSEGKIKDNSGLAQYAILHTERESIPGVKDANVCQNAYNPSLWDLFVAAITGTSAVANSCNNVNEKVATGQEYGNTASNTNWNTSHKYYQGYFLETYVLDMLGYYTDHCLENPTTAYKKEFYQKNPKDNSPEGRLARRTGMSKEDVIAGIEALQFIAYLNNYDPSTRLAFGQTKKPEQIHFEEVETNDFVATLADEKKKIIYNDRRNRVQKSLMV